MFTLLLLFIVYIHCMLRPNCPSSCLQVVLKESAVLLFYCNYLGLFYVGIVLLICMCSVYGFVGLLTCLCRIYTVQKDAVI
jgi:hypothetical protein